MSDSTGSIDARGTSIDKVVQVNAPGNQGTISVPIVPGSGRTLMLVEHIPTRHITDNLAAASAQQNSSFIGRLKQLDELSTLVNAASGPAAVAIVAGAGFGKSELAKHFINTCVKTAAPGASTTSLAADQWTHRWWLDGSKGGEAASLRQHYATITGQSFPDEPKPAPDADAAQVAAAFRTQLRRAIAAACSTGRQLLVIDNAESPAQIKEYRPANAGRLIATTRRQPIAGTIAHEFSLDIMSLEDARAVLAAKRPDLQAPHHAKDLDAIALHLGHHALALAYAAAALARPPLKTPQAILARMTQADIGDEAHILSEFTEQDLGIDSKRGLAQSLGLLLDELAEAGSPGHDPLALTLANLMAFCNPAAIPVSLLVAASGAPEATVEKSLRALHQRSIITLTDTAAMHQLTQSLLRGRLTQHSGPGFQPTLARLLTALFALFNDATLHTKYPARTVAMPHAESVIAYACQPASAAGAGAAAARLRAEVARHLYVTGQLADATRHIEAAVAFGEAQSPRDERSLAIDYASRATIRQLRGDGAGAEADIQQSIDWGEAQSPRDERSLAVCYASRASIRQNRGDLAGAEADIQKSIDWGEAQSPRDERSLAIDYAWRASIRVSRGDLAGAEADIKRSIDYEESQTPRNERGLAVCYASRARIRQNRGELAGAEADIKMSLDWGEAQSPRNERSLAICYALRARIRLDRGDFARAEADIQMSLDWHESQSPRAERSLAINYATRASIRREVAIKARAAGDTAAATAGFKAARADIEAALAWCLANLPNDERVIDILRKTKASIDATESKIILPHLRTRWPRASSHIGSTHLRENINTFESVLCSITLFQTSDTSCHVRSFLPIHLYHQPWRTVRLLSPIRVFPLLRSSRKSRLCFRAKRPSSRR